MGKARFVPDLLEYIANSTLVPQPEPGEIGTSFHTRVIEALLSATNSLSPLVSDIASNHIVLLLREECHLVTQVIHVSKLYNETRSKTDFVALSNSKESAISSSPKNTLGLLHCALANLKCRNLRFILRGRDLLILRAVNHTLWKWKAGSK